MRKHLALLSFCLIVSGCVTLETGPSAPEIPLTKIGQVHTGMALETVKGIMGPEFVVGFEKDPSSDKLNPITIPQPYRTEEIEKDDKKYFVAYYFTHIKKADEMISDDELTPLIFSDGILSTIGWDSLFPLKQK